MMDPNSVKGQLWEIGRRAISLTSMLAIILWLGPMFLAWGVVGAGRIVCPECEVVPSKDQPVNKGFI
jgi:hypothetical protein